MLLKVVCTVFWTKVNWKQVAGCWTPYQKPCFELKRTLPGGDQAINFIYWFFVQFITISFYSSRHNTYMGSAIGIARGTDSRNKTCVTQLRQENVRLQARIERLSAEASRLKAEINAMLKDKELLTCSINGEHIHHFSPTNGEAL